MLFRRKKYRLNKNTANSTLQNVFAACEQEPNSVPFDKFVLEQKLNIMGYNRFITVLCIVLLLTFLAPCGLFAMACLSEILPVPEVNLSDHSVENGKMHLTFDSGNIIYHEAYSETADGHREPVLSYDTGTHTLAFPYAENTERNIYIPVYGAETIHFLITPNQ